jgi:hypothetical protein
MRINLTSAAVLVLALIAGAARAAAPRPDFAAIEKAFVCPETLADDQARKDAIAAFMDAVAKAAPGMSIADLLLYRRELLENHGCARTLASLAAGEAAVRAGAVLDQAWWPVGDAPSVSLFVASDYLKLFVDPRFPGEHAVETFVKLQFAAPRQTDVTQVTYDLVISHNVYYCSTHRYALIENDYFLKGQPVHKDPSPVAAQLGSIAVYALTPTPRGSLNEVASRWACGARSGQAN